MPGLHPFHSLVLAVLALFSPLASRAAPVEGRAAKSARVDAYGTLDDCLKDDRCWGLALTAFSELLPATLTEVEAGGPGQFFPKTLAFAKERADKEGHFLQVDCLRDDGGRQPCDDKRDALEQRALTVNLFRSLPIEDKPKELYDKKTWEMRPAGAQALAKIKKRRPDVWLQLAKIARNLRRR
ncbi:MAG: hypothetical protein HY077_11670 [Elusimicrobia bacterium]|nr:hypothetical protein [Elusimicrobiota bacterium]